METAEIVAISAVVLLVAAEIFCLFLCSRLKCKSYPMCIVIPVRSSDEELPQRLDFIGSLIEEGSPLIGDILIMDIDADEKQLLLCSEFCGRYHAAEIVLPEDIEKYIKNYLHFEQIYSII